MGLGGESLDLTPKAQAVKAKLDKRDHIKLKEKLLPSKGKRPQNEKATYCMGESICQLYTREGFGIQNT